MTDAVIIAAIVGVPSTIGAVTGFVAMLRSAKNSTKLDAAAVVMDEVHKAVNSNMAAAVAEIKEGKETIARLTEKASTQFETQMVALRAQVAEQERTRAALETATQAAAALTAQQRYREDDPPSRGRR